MAANDPIQRLHVRLLKPEIRTPADALIDPSGLQSYRLRKGLGLKGSLFVAAPNQGAPSWLRFVETGTRKPLRNLTNRTNAAVLVLRAGRRFFAYTFSHGWHLLREEHLVPDFGIKAALNGLRHDSLRSLDSYSLEDQTVHRRAQASRASSIEVFGLDVSRDILRAVTGDPRDDAKARGILAITGCEAALSVSARVAFADLSSLSRELLTIYNQRAYREHFNWVDNVSRVRDSHLIDDLDGLLLGDLSAAQPSARLAPPAPIDFERFDGFTYPRLRKERAFDLDVTTYLSAMPAAELSKDRLLRDKIHLFNEGGHAPSVQWPTYRCLVFEVSKDDYVFVLSNGAWYQIEKSFAQRTKRSARSIPTCPVKLPKVRRVADGKLESERAYNQRAHDGSSRLLLMDGATARCRNTSSSIEFCDLFSAQRRVIHVKHRKDSSVLSHLFAQGRVSAEALVSDEDFRRGVRKHLHERRAAWESKVPIARPAPADFEIVFCLLGTTDRQPADELPFFSQLILVRTHDDLLSRGFRVTVRGVPEEAL